MFINYEYNAIFFHNVKCGGNFICDILHNYNFNEICADDHYNYINFVDDESYIKDIKYKHTIRKLGKYRYFYSHQDINKEFINKFFKFIFVRNPYTKILSAYLYLKRKLFKTSDNTINKLEENPEYFIDFNIFVKNYKNVNNISFFHAFIPQFEQIIDFSNNSCFEFIGKTEQLNDDLMDIFTFLNINNVMEIFNKKKCNESIYEKDITEYYNEESFYFVNEFFKKDFEIFSYKKYETFHEFKTGFNYCSKTPNTGITTVKNIKSEECLDIEINYEIPKYFMHISSIIKNRKDYIDNQLIPKNIIQTYKDNYLHPQIYENTCKILSKNQSYDYYFITDEDGINLIKEYFDINTLNAFKKLKVGAAKGDFIRYIALYIYGGIYLDMDAGIEIDLDKFIPKNNEYLFIYDSSKMQITNWCIMITPRHIIMKKIIDEMVNRIHQNIENNILLVTGPKLITDVIYNYFTNSKIYNLELHITHDSFLKFIIKNNSPPIFFESYVLTILLKQFLFNFNGYNDHMLYYNEIKYDRIENYNIYFQNYKNVLISSQSNQSSILSGPQYKTIYDCIEYVNSICENSNKEFLSDDICKYLIKLNTFNEIISKFKNIFDILIDELLKRSNYKMSIINVLKNEINELHQKYIDQVEENKIIKKKINDIFFNEKKKYILKTIQYCEKCNFKCYNTTAYIAHKYFCK